MSFEITSCRSEVSGAALGLGSHSVWGWPTLGVPRAREAKADLVHGLLQGGEHKALIAPVRRQGPVVEAPVAPLVPQGEGVRELVHLSSHVGLRPLCLPPPPPPPLPAALLDGLQKLTEQSTGVTPDPRPCAPGPVASDTFSLDGDQVSPST